MPLVGTVPAPFPAVGEQHLEEAGPAACHAGAVMAAPAVIRKLKHSRLAGVMRWRKTSRGEDRGDERDRGLARQQKSAAVQDVHQGAGGNGEQEHRQAVR